MLVSASFLSSKNIPETLRKLNETDVDFIHVDIMDGKFVKNKTMPFKEMRHIHEFTNKRLDVHLMVNTPSKYIADYASLNAEYITIHLESDENVIENLKLIRSYAIKAGLAIKPETKIEELVPYLPYIDLILVLGVEPGQGGQEFLSQTTKRLEELETLRKSYKEFPIKISIDGGMNSITKQQVEDKVDIIISGSFITNSKDYQSAITSLR